MNLTVVDRLGIEPADKAGRHVREENVLAPDRVLREDLAFEHRHAAREDVQEARGGELAGGEHHGCE